MRDSVVVVVCALLVTLNVPVAAPAVVGLKVMVKGTLWPAGMVTGSESPLTLKTELFVLAAVTLTLAPLAVRVPEPVPLVPTTTLPNPRVVGLMASVPTTEVPVPVSPTVRLGLEAFDEMVTLPDALPVAVGVKVTVNVVSCPAFSATGVVIPLNA